MSHKQYKIFVTNDESLVSEIKQGAKNYAGQAIIFVNPSDTDLKEAMKTKDFDIIQVNKKDIKANNYDRKMIISNNVAPRQIAIVGEHYTVEHMLKDVFKKR